jgi:hypothetical protein
LFQVIQMNLYFFYSYPVEIWSIFKRAFFLDLVTKKSIKSEVSTEAGNVSSDYEFAIGSLKKIKLIQIDEQKSSESKGPTYIKLYKTLKNLNGLKPKIIRIKDDWTFS